MVVSTTIHCSRPLEWKHGGEVALLINGLWRRAFTHAGERISSLSLHWTETVLRYELICPQHCVASPPTPKDCHICLQRHSVPGSGRLWCRKSRFGLGRNAACFLCRLLQVCSARAAAWCLAAFGLFKEDFDTFTGLM